MVKFHIMQMGPRTGTVAYVLYSVGKLFVLRVYYVITVVFVMNQIVFRNQTKKIIRFQHILIWFQDCFVFTRADENSSEMGK